MNAATRAINSLQIQLTSSGSAAQYHELAALQLAGGNLDGALAAYSKCLTLEPHNAAIHNNYGVALIKAGRFADAIASLESAVALRPGYQRALVNLGKALREIGRSDQAIARLRAALDIEPDYVPALVNLGDAYAATADWDLALAALGRAVSIAPDHVEARTALGMAQLQAGFAAQSLDTLRAAVALAPDHADARSNLAHALFCAGDWQAAWPHFEARFRRTAHRSALQPPQGASSWEGSITPDLDLWLVGEQGLGDQLQFARYAKLIQERGVRCTLACDPRLLAILRTAKLAERIVPLGASRDDDVSVDAGTARWLPLMSAPAWHGTQPETVPFARGYLAADTERVGHWRARLPGAAGLRVALAWAGNPAMETGRYAGRSPPLASFAPLLAVPTVSFVSLQKGAGEEQLREAAFGTAIHCPDGVDAGPDGFIDTAAILQCVDLLITSDSAIAHLAGGLGVPCWLSLMHEPDWRWMRRGEATPWYASMRLFRQSAPGDWAGVFSEMAGALALSAARR
jgi:tetratricopeptide (TPR) repeat protein